MPVKPEDEDDYEFIYAHMESDVNELEKEIARMIPCTEFEFVKSSSRSIAENMINEVRKNRNRLLKIYYDTVGRLSVQTTYSIKEIENLLDMFRLIESRLILLITLLKYINTNGIDITSLRVGDVIHTKSTFDEDAEAETSILHEIRKLKFDGIYGSRDFHPAFFLPAYREFVAKFPHLDQYLYSLWFNEVPRIRFPEDIISVIRAGRAG
jgi:hypothetical protein